LYDSARSIHLEIPMRREQVTDAVLSTVRANKKDDGYIRLVVTRGAGTLGLDPRKTSDPQIIIIVDDISMYPPDLYQNGLETEAANNPVQQIALTRHDVFAADECFLTGTAAEVIPVVKCDDRVIGTGKPGPITCQLRERFHQLARTE